MTIIRLAEIFERIHCQDLPHVELEADLNLRWGGTHTAQMTPLIKSTWLTNLSLYRSFSIGVNLL